MAKTQLTTDLERQIYTATAKQGVFGCFEVTIGWFGKERVDYITYDTKGVWRCYEIKVSKADFHSKAKKTFLGHFNYFVMTKDLYEEVKDEIPNHIGVYVGDYLVKRAKKQELGIDEKILKDSLIRSLYREVDKQIRSNNPTLIEGLERRLRNAKTEADKYKHKYWDLLRIGEKKYGSRWYREEDA
jgi:hypothetical protein